MSEAEFAHTVKRARELACSDTCYAPSTSEVNGLNWANDEIGRLRVEVERLTEMVACHKVTINDWNKSFGLIEAERDQLAQRVCDECDAENYGWVFNRVEGRGACTCMVEAEPFQILLTALETISKAATGETQIADDDTEGMRWIAGKAMEALHSVLPLDYEAPVPRLNCGDDF